MWQCCSSYWHADKLCWQTGNTVQRQQTHDSQRKGFWRTSHSPNHLLKQLFIQNPRTHLFLSHFKGHHYYVKMDPFPVAMSRLFCEISDSTLLSLVHTYLLCLPFLRIPCSSTYLHCDFSNVKNRNHVLPLWLPHITLNCNTTHSIELQDSTYCL